MGKSLIIPDADFSQNCINKYKTVIWRGDRGNSIPQSSYAQDTADLPGRYWCMYSVPHGIFVSLEQIVSKSGDIGFMLIRSQDIPENPSTTTIISNFTVLKQGYLTLGQNGKYVSQETLDFTSPDTFLLINNFYYALGTIVPEHYIDYNPGESPYIAIEVNQGNAFGFNLEIEVLDD